MTIFLQVYIRYLPGCNYPLGGSTITNANTLQTQWFQSSSLKTKKKNQEQEKEEKDDEEDEDV